MISRDVFLSRQNKLRAGWRILLYLFLAGLCTLIAMSAYDALAHYRASAAGTGAQPGMTTGMYVSLFIGVLLPAFFMLRVVDRQPLRVLGFALHGRVWIEAGQGILQGTCMITMIFIVEWTAGWAGASWSGLRPLAAFRFTGYYLLFFTIAGAFEEALLRGYAFQVLVQGIGKIGAVCITSFVFGLAHLLNPNVNPFAIANTMLAGVWLSAAYLKTRSLWLPTSLHMAWNVAQGFVFGFPVSGMPLAESLVRLTQHGREWATGGIYGPEGGALSPLILILATIYIMRSKRVRPRENAVALWSALSEQASSNGPGSRFTNDEWEA